jgi:hypothetical protein
MSYQKKQEIDRLVDAIFCLGATSSLGRGGSRADDIKLSLARGLYRVAGITEPPVPAQAAEDGDKLVCSECGGRFDNTLVGKEAIYEHLKKHNASI